MSGKCATCEITCERYKCETCSWEDAYSGAIKELESVIKILTKKERVDYSQEEDTANIATRIMKKYNLVVDTLTTIASFECIPSIYCNDNIYCCHCLARKILKEI